MKLKKWLIVIAALLAVMCIAIEFGIQAMGRDGASWGRDTVKQFCGGAFGITRNSASYSFDSLDNQVHLNGITAYYCGEETLYLIGDRFYACVDLANEALEQHETLGEFSEDRRQIFSEEERFTELPAIKETRNIWQILFGG